MKLLKNKKSGDLDHLLFTSSENTSANYENMKEELNEFIECSSHPSLDPEITYNL